MDDEGRLRIGSTYDVMNVVFLGTGNESGSQLCARGGGAHEGAQLLPGSGESSDSCCDGVYISSSSRLKKRI